MRGEIDADEPVRAIIYSLLDGNPIVVVQPLLLTGWQIHEDKVADLVTLGEADAGGVEGLEDALCVVMVFQVKEHDLEVCDAVLKQFLRRKRRRPQALTEVVVVGRDVLALDELGSRLEEPFVGFPVIIHWAQTQFPGLIRVGDEVIIEDFLVRRMSVHSISPASMACTKARSRTLTVVRRC